MISNDDILKRADELLERIRTGTTMDAMATTEAYFGALTLVNHVYGHSSVQSAQLTLSMAAADKVKDGNRAHSIRETVRPAVIGALISLKADIASGLTGSIALRASGEVLGDLLSLAKEALADGGEAQKNVAAVLVAAAFEDTIRRLAEKEAGVTGRPKLLDVIAELKKADVLRGAAVSTAQGYLKFRNDALHADWQSADRTVVLSCLSFVEAMLLQHFS